MLPGDFPDRRVGTFGAQRVVGEGEPCQGRQAQQPVRQLGQAIGRNADQLQLVTLRKGCGQGAQAVAGEHQLLQVWAAAQFVGQQLDAVIGEDQPAQARRQCRGADLLYAVGLEADSLQLRALANAFRQVHKGVV